MKFSSILTLFLVICLALPIIGQLDLVEDTEITTRAGTHTVFAEDLTATWCVHCPPSSDNLEKIEESGAYDFKYVCLIDDMVQDAADRVDEFNPGGFPLVMFDAGYDEVSGNQSSAGTSNFEEAIETCEPRDVRDIDVDVACTYEGAKLSVDVEVTNNEGDAYNGLLRVYVIEKVSRYLDYNGHYYPNGFIGFAVDETFTVEGSGSYSTEGEWDGTTEKDLLGDDFSDIEIDNIEIYALVFNGDGSYKKHEGLNAKFYTQKLNDAFDECVPTKGSGSVTPPPPPPPPPGVPEVSIKSPSNGATVEGEVTIKAGVSSENDLSSVKVRIDGASWMNMLDSGSEYTYIWDTSTAAAGNHQVEVQATDVLSETGSKSITIKVKEEEAPAEIEITNIKFTPSEPTDADKVMISCDVFSPTNALQTVKIQVCEGDMCFLPEEMTEAGGDTYTYENDKYAAGTDVSFQITATDVEGNKETTEKIHYIVKASSIDPPSTDDDDDDDDTTEPKESPGFELVGMIIVSVFVLLCLIAWRKKRN